MRSNLAESECVVWMQSVHVNYVILLSLSFQLPFRLNKFRLEGLAEKNWFTCISWTWLFNFNPSVFLYVSSLIMCLFSSAKYSGTLLKYWLESIVIYVFGRPKLLSIKLLNYSSLCTCYDKLFCSINWALMICFEYQLWFNFAVFLRFQLWA